MLLFVDQPKHIRVVRKYEPDGTATRKRERLGLIAKTSLEPTPELESALLPEEKDELGKAIEMFRHSQAVSKQAAALNFPETMRVVVDYLQKGASESEKKIIVSALMEGVRLVRKAAKAEASRAFVELDQVGVPSHAP
jgi:hypothetical protein